MFCSWFELVVPGLNSGGGGRDGHEIVCVGGVWGGGGLKTPAPTLNPALWESISSGMGCVGRLVAQAREI